MGEDDVAVTLHRPLSQDIASATVEAKPLTDAVAIMSLTRLAEHMDAVQVWQAPKKFCYSIRG